MSGWVINRLGHRKKRGGWIATSYWITSSARRSVLLLAYAPRAGATFFEGSETPGADLRARAKVGGKNERLREYRLSHFRLQTRRERNWGGRFIGTFPIRGRGEGHFSALSIHGYGGQAPSRI